MKSLAASEFLASLVMNIAIGMRTTISVGDENPDPRVVFSLAKRVVRYKARLKYIPALFSLSLSEDLLTLGVHNYPHTISTRF